MTYKSFEDYLYEKHADQYVGLDDDMPDDYQDWFAALDINEVVEYADEYVNKLKKEKVL